MGTPSMGHATRIGSSASGAATREYDFLTCQIGKTKELIVSDGVRGTRSYLDQQAVFGPYVVGGVVTMDVRPDDLDTLLPLILGGTETAGSFPLAETLPESDWTVDKEVKVYTYADMKVNTANFSGNSGQKLQLALDLQGKTETEGNAGTFPAISGTLSVKRPYIFHQVTLTLDSVAREFNQFNLLIDNALLLDRTMNSATRTQIPEGNRRIILTVQSPFTSDEIALYDLAIAGITGTLVFTDGTDTLTFTFANLKKPTRPVGIAGKTQEIMQPLELQAFATQSGATITRELVVTSTNN